MDRSALSGETAVAGERSVRVGLFVTCLVDLMRPSVGFAAMKLLEDAGCIVDAPVQTCCGQPAYNSGDRGTTRDLAMRMIEAFHTGEQLAWLALHPEFPQPRAGIVVGHGAIKCGIDLGDAEHVDQEARQLMGLGR